MLKLSGKKNETETKKRRKISIKITDVTLDGYLTEFYDDQCGTDLLENEFIEIETTFNGAQYITTIRTQYIEFITESKTEKP